MDAAALLPPDRSCNFRNDMSTIYSSVTSILSTVDLTPAITYSSRNNAVSAAILMETSVPEEAILANTTVFDMSRVLAGPYCAQLLADLGATVIKVEAPEGDENRRWPPFDACGKSANFASVNRGKRGMVLDLKADHASLIVDRIAKKADVVIHSYLPDTAGRLGLGYERMRAINPALIYCTISGYGDQGPLRHKPGYDLMMQAFAGVMSMTGAEGGSPVRAGVSFIDMATGMAAYAGVVSALLSRSKTGRGNWVRASLLETAVSLLGYHAVSWLQCGVLPKKEGSGVWHLVPYQAFACKDGYVLVGATNDAVWERFCGVLEKPELAKDARFATIQDRVEQKDVLIALIEPLFKNHTVLHWVERFEAVRVPVSPLQTVDKVMQHPQVLANQMVVSAEDAAGRAAPFVGLPFKIEGATTSRDAPPDLGADTDMILRDVLMFSEREIESIHAGSTVDLQEPVNSRRR